MKRFLSILIMCVLLMQCGVAMAAEQEEAGLFSSNYFSSYGITLSADGDGVIGISFSTVGVGLCSELGVSTFEVEKKVDGGWMDVTDLVEGETGTNTSSYSFARNFQGIVGAEYRVQCTFICVKNGSSETKAYTSGTIKAK